MIKKFANQAAMFLYILGWKVGKLILKIFIWPYSYVKIYISFT